MFTIPILNVQANPLDALLATIGFRLSMLSNSDNDAFLTLLENRNVTIQISSEADGVVRYYTFNNGDFSQYSGFAANPDLVIDFQDSMTGVKLLTGGDVTAFMSAIQEKKLTMQGDYSLLMWFNQLAKHIVPAVPEELQPYIKQAEPYLQKAKPYAKKAQATAIQIMATIKNKLDK